MTPAAERPQVRHFPSVAGLLDRPDVVAFQPTGPAARRAPPAVAVEDGSANATPPGRVRPRWMAPTH